MPTSNLTCKSKKNNTDRGGLAKHLQLSLSSPIIFLEKTAFKKDRNPLKKALKRIKNTLSMVNKCLLGRAIFRGSLLGRAAFRRQKALKDPYPPLLKSTSHFPTIFLKKKSFLVGTWEVLLRKGG